jgi:hypothetical protein
MSYVGLYDDAGSKNAFYIIKDKKIGRKRVGFKEFENEQEARFAHRVQSHLAQFNLAPMVYGDIGMIRRHDGELTAYGYLTEVARPMPKCYDEYCDGECFMGECKNGTTIAAVVDGLNEHGLEYSDAHKGNFGYVRRKGSWVPVAIDLGVESFSDWDEDIYGKFDYDADSDGYVDSCGVCNCVHCRQYANPER